MIGTAARPASVHRNGLEFPFSADEMSQRYDSSESQGHPPHASDRREFSVSADFRYRNKLKRRWGELTGEGPAVDCSERTIERRHCNEVYAGNDRYAKRKFEKSGASED
jgi:hypothetical protein